MSGRRSHCFNRNKISPPGGTPGRLGGLITNKRKIGRHRMQLAEELPDAFPDRTMFGIGSRILAAGCFSVLAALLKLASVRGVSVPELVFYRSAFGLPIVFGCVLIGPGLSVLNTSRPTAHIWRSCLGFIAMLLTFSSLSLLPLAEATAFNFTAPIFATLLSALIIGERIGLHRWGAVLVGFLGVLLMLRVTGSGLAVPAFGVGIALTAALAQGFVTITLRQLQGEHVAAIVFWFVTAMSLAGAMMLPFYGQMHDATTLAILLGAGIFGALAQLLMTASLVAAPVSVLMPFDYLQFIGATLLGWFLFSSLPNGYTFAGAAVIACGGIYTAFREHRGWRARNCLRDSDPEVAVRGIPVSGKFESCAGES